MYYAWFLYKNTFYSIRNIPKLETTLTQILLKWKLIEKETSSKSVLYKIHCYQILSALMVRKKDSLQISPQLTL